MYTESAGPERTVGGWGTSGAWEPARDAESAGSAAVVRHIFYAGTSPSALRGEKPQVAREPQPGIRRSRHPFRAPSSNVLHTTVARPERPAVATTTEGLARKGLRLRRQRGGARPERAVVATGTAKIGRLAAMRKLARRTRSARYSPAVRSLEHASQLRREEASRSYNARQDRPQGLEPAPGAGCIRRPIGLAPLLTIRFSHPHNLGLP